MPLRIIRMVQNLVVDVMLSLLCLEEATPLLDQGAAAATPG